MVKRAQFLFFVVFICMFNGRCLAAVRVETLDTNKDGRPDKWIQVDSSGSVYLREWDRNFDGKADLKVYEALGKFVEKHYDDNFDGHFEKIVKAPKKGSTGRTKTRVVAS